MVFLVCIRGFSCVYLTFQLAYKYSLTCGEACRLYLNRVGPGLIAMFKDGNYVVITSN